MGTVSIPLTRGQVAIIDEEDAPLVSGSSWYAVPNTSGTFYAGHSGTNRKGTKGVQFLHNVIMQPPDDMFVDHISGDGLDCQRSNMRLCTFMQNSANRRQHSHSTSPYKGVHWHKGERKWHARVLHDGKRHHLGAFDTPEEAAHAYDRKAIILFGEFARTNFPRDEYGDVPVIEQRARRNNTIGFTGVSYDPRADYWYARIFMGGKGRHIGTFPTAEDAARARDAKVKELGLHLRLNFPDKEH